MFADDIALVAEVAAKYGPLPQPIVEVGGLEDPCVAEYELTITAMKTARTQDEIAAAQQSRYLALHRPLEASAPGYRCEDPGAGGCSIEQLSDKYGYASIGTIICLSTLEHVEDPFSAAFDLVSALRKDGLLIVSVPFEFPYHPSPKDFFRFSPDGLRSVFKLPELEIVECGWRLQIPASAGVCDPYTGQPQAVRSCALVARAR